MTSRVRVFSRLLALTVAAVLGCGLAAPAQERPPALWFQGTRLVLEHPVPSAGDLAVAIGDGGLRRFLERLGATVSYQPGQRYVIVTSQDRRTIVFTLGDDAYTVGGVRARAPFAPFADGADPVLPFFALARALYVEPVADGAETVLQPRVGALEVRADGGRTTITVRAAMPLVARPAAEGAERFSVAFLGLGSALAPVRRSGGAVETVELAAGGSARVPTTTLTVLAPPGTTHRIVPAAAPGSFTVVFESRLAAGPPAPAAAGSPGATALAAAPPPAAPPTLAPLAPRAAASGSPAPLGASARPTLSAPPLIVAGRATVTDVAIEPAADDGLAVRLTISAAVPYRWHRLADHRWYVDLLGATLSGPGRDERPPSGPVQAVRVRQTGTSDAPAVRVAFTLSGEQRIDLTPGESGLTIVVATAPGAELARSGAGRTGGAPRRRRARPRPSRCPRPRPATPAAGSTRRRRPPTPTRT